MKITALDLKEIPDFINVLEKYASKHYPMHMKHNVVISAEPNENWAWCYEHKSFVKY